MNATSGGTRPWWATRPPRTDTPSITVGRAYAEVLVVFGVFFASGIAVAAFTLNGTLPVQHAVSWSVAAPDAIEQVSTTVLCVMVPVLLVLRRGLERTDLGLVQPPAPSVPVGIRMAAWGVLGLIGFGVVARLLSPHHAIGSLATSNLVVLVLHGAQAGFIEEVVVLGFVVVTLEQARRPVAEIVVVDLLLRASYHIYYGPGVLGAFVFGGMFLWLFLRFRSIVPIIVLHSAWDVLIVLGDRWPGVRGFDGLLILGVLITAPITWLVTRSNAGRPGVAGVPGTPPLAPPGWYPDPWLAGHQRWYDGWRWHTATHPWPGDAPGTGSDAGSDAGPDAGRVPTEPADGAPGGPGSG